MSRRDEDRFRVRPGAPKHRGDAFINQVLRQTSRAANASGGRRGKTPGSRLGRGHVAARFTGQSLSAHSRRATVKVRLAYLKQAGARSTVTHLRYIEREGVGRDGEPGRAYGTATDEADLTAFEERGRGDRHQFRFIVSPEDGAELGDLHTYTRHLMTRMEADLGTRLDWVAVDHWNTDNPHTHIVLRGKDGTGRDLIISQAYLTRGLRERAAELATQWLGPRTEQEIQRTLAREVEQERWTNLDRTLQREAVNGQVHVERLSEPWLHRQREMLIGRLQHLQRMGLASQPQTGAWVIHIEAEPTLRAMGERGDIIRTMQRAMSGMQRELAVFEPREDGRVIVGRVAAKGLADELYDKGYLVVDGTDGKAHYVTLPPRSELERYPTGSIVQIKGSAGTRASDKTVAALAVDGLYRTDQHPKFGVIFAGLGLIYSLKDLEPVFRLMKALNEKANFQLVPMVGHYNMRGFNENLFAETGYVNRVKFENGTVKHGPEYSVVESLKAKTVDAALIIGSDPLSSLPRSVSKNLLEIPVISIDPCETLTSKHSKVYINTAISGVESGGSATRMDGIKVSFKPVVETARLSDEATLKKIMEAL